MRGLTVDVYHYYMPHIIRKKWRENKNICKITIYFCPSCMCVHIRHKNTHHTIQKKSLQKTEFKGFTFMLYLSLWHFIGVSVWMLYFCSQRKAEACMNLSFFAIYLHIFSLFSIILFIFTVFLVILSCSTRPIFVATPRVYHQVQFVSDEKMKILSRKKTVCAEMMLSLTKISVWFRLWYVIL